jgi:hypothetical protein
VSGATGWESDPDRVTFRHTASLLLPGKIGTADNYPVAETLKYSRLACLTFVNYIDQNYGSLLMNIVAFVPLSCTGGLSSA